MKEWKKRREGMTETMKSSSRCSLAVNMKDVSRKSRSLLVAFSRSNDGVGEPFEERSQSA